jgi:hypothetical protein
MRGEREWLRFRDHPISLASVSSLSVIAIDRPITTQLIRAGIDPVWASRQLGHARPSLTLDIYAHEFDRARGLDDVRDSINAAFGSSRI